MPPAKASRESSGEATGHSSLPLARIKRIIRADEDIVQCSTSATFLIAVATEMFVQYLTEQGYNVVRSNNLKNLRYADIVSLATAVSRIDNLEFLSDVIPKTTTYGKFKEKRAREKAKEDGQVVSQRTLKEMQARQNGTPERSREESMVDVGERNVNELSPRPPMVIHASRSRSRLVDEDAAQQRPDRDNDVEMTL
ncbi:putative DNA-directed DNA polymerase [Microsporum ferrugineum]